MRMISMIVCGLALFVGSAFAEDKKQENKAPAKGKEMTLWAAGEIQWGPEMPDSHGVTVAPLWGDMMKGAHGVLVRFPAGWSEPLHTHSAVHKGVVLSGTFVLTNEGGQAKKLGPGSYLMIPGGVRHSAACEGGCVIYSEGDGKFDNKLVGEKKEGAKKEEKKGNK